MDEFYRVIEDKIRRSGYDGPTDGEDIYNDICDQMEDKDSPGGISAYSIVAK